MNWATVIVLIIVLALVVLAIRGLRRGKGKCSCEQDNKTGGSCASCSLDCPLRKR